MPRSQLGKFLVVLYLPERPNHLLTHLKSSEEDGAFAEYAMVRDGHIASIAENLSFEETATLGVGVTSIGQSLYMTMGLPLPGEKPAEGAPFFLVYGGSSATGTLAIHNAKLQVD